MRNKRAKENRRQIRKEYNKIFRNAYDNAYFEYTKDYLELSLWQKIKLAFETEKIKRGKNV